VWSFAVLGIGLFLMAMLQTWYGLGPLRRVRLAIARIRTTGANRVTDPLPQEVQPMVEELNALLAHSETQAEEARRHAGNLAHALKTPLTVLTNAASAHAPDLDTTVLREAAVMRRQVDHHLARARAVGRRAFGHSRTNVLASVEGVQRAVSRLYPHVRFDFAGVRDAEVAIEPQDLDEILGNLIENAAKYGGGSVFVTVDPDPAAEKCAVEIEDDGPGISEEDRARCSAAARGSTPRSPAPASASRSCATWSRSTAARSSSGRARTSAGLLVRVRPAARRRDDRRRAAPPLLLGKLDLDLVVDRTRSCECAARTPRSCPRAPAAERGEGDVGAVGVRVNLAAALVVDPECRDRYRRRRAPRDRPTGRTG
jgi:hypothetical protein